ncbi:MAG: hypothetical protein H0U53_11020 [Actinobacteria bacterium]|nr:hypothetical protein [Actinomycetota bacterium]
MYTLTNQEYSKSKAALTRAQNSGDNEKLVKVVREAVALFNEKGWPDNWTLWRNALDDAGWSSRCEDEGRWQSRQLLNESSRLFDGF